MSAKLLVLMIFSFVLTDSVCASSSITTEDNKPDKASSSVVKCDGKAKNENVYISENMLYVKTPLVNDLIYIYTASGLCIDKFVKDTELVVKNVSAYPDGELIVTNGKELTITIIK